MSDESLTLDAADQRDPLSTMTGDLGEILESKPATMVYLRGKFKEFETAIRRKDGQIKALNEKIKENEKRDEERDKKIADLDKGRTYIKGSLWAVGAMSSVILFIVALIPLYQFLKGK